MTIGEIVERLCGIGHVTYGGASLFHDELGHIISAIMLTRWPEDPRFRAPVVWSTETIVPEQLAELCQRMLIRASPRCITDGIASNRIHVKGTLDDAMIRRIEDRLSEQIPGTLTMNWPDEHGDKLSKREALAWTYLFAIEDIHIFAERYSIKKYGQPLDTARLARFREQVAELMYIYAVNPDISGVQAHARSRYQTIRDCFEALGLQREREAEIMFGQHLSDELLNRWYDTFLSHFDALDSTGSRRFGQAFSRLSLDELHQLEARGCVPEIRAPFDWIFAGEPVKSGEQWLGVVDYDERRRLWLVVDAIPPEHRTSSAVSARLSSPSSPAGYRRYRPADGR